MISACRDRFNGHNAFAREPTGASARFELTERGALFVVHEEIIFGLEY